MILNFCSSTLEALTDKEWLITNGIGGYASSTIAGANTRRYHGLLIAAFNPPTDRKVLVSKIEEHLILDESNIGLSCNVYPETIHPEGFQHIISFSRSPLTTTTYEFQNYRLCKTLFMIHGSNTSIVEYQNLGTQAFKLELNPLYVFRDYHSLFRANDYYDFYSEDLGENCYKIYAHYDAEPFFFSFSKGDFQHTSNWFYNFEYPKEKYRGLDFQEDAKSIGKILVHLDPLEKVYILFTTDPNMLTIDVGKEKAKQINRLSSLVIHTEDDFIKDLQRSGDQFLVHRNSSNSKTIIAGYPWFTDWGRDTMIAMRGLTIATRNQEVSKSIIHTFLQYLDQGMIPNRFPDYGETPEYNSIDASLWIFVVLYEYYEQFQDQEFVAEVYPDLCKIIEHYQKGTRFGIHCTPEGLVYGGEELSQLTWMDARIGDFVVTPRQGCPVEINALWYNALCVLEIFQKLLQSSINPAKKSSKEFRRIFRKYFVNEEGYLNDVVIPEKHVDSRIRPNQIYAISLPFCPLTSEETQSVLEIVEKHLYTDFGLRSLSQEHPDFVPKYEGDSWHRDSAYHQGTVWAFLWGEFATAYLQAHQYSKKSIDEITKRVETLKKHFYQSDCIHGISEIFDGQAPSAGRGCIHQAWSVGMLLKVLLDMEGKK